MAIPFLAVEISGLATQTYNSGAVNRKFINDVSGAIWTQMGTLDDTPTTWSDVTTSTGLTPITFGVSGSEGTSVSVLGYATISANAKLGADYVASGNEYSAAYNWYVASAQKLSAKSSGWASVADTDTIAHGLSAKPSWHIVAPSGAVTFAVATTVDATNITVRISAAGSRMVSWRAEV